MEDMRGYEFDFRRFVDDMGGPMAVWRALRGVGMHVEKSTVSKWRERNDIATVYLVNLMAHRALHDGPVDLNAYIVPAKDAGGPSRPRASQLVASGASGPGCHPTTSLGLSRP